MRKSAIVSGLTVDRVATAELMFSSAGPNGDGSEFAELTAGIDWFENREDGNKIALRLGLEHGHSATELAGVTELRLSLNDVFRLHAVTGAMLAEYGLLIDAARDLLKRASAPRRAGTFAVCTSMHGWRGKSGKR